MRECILQRVTTKHHFGSLKNKANITIGKIGKWRKLQTRDTKCEMNVSLITERDYEDMCVCGKNVVCIRIGIRRSLSAVNIDKKSAEMAEIRQSLAVQAVELLGPGSRGGLERMAHVLSLMETQSVCV